MDNMAHTCVCFILEDYRLVYIKAFVSTNTVCKEKDREHENILCLFLLVGNIFLKLSFKVRSYKSGVFVYLLDLGESVFSGQKVGPLRNDFLLLTSLP